MILLLGDGGVLSKSIPTSWSGVKNAYKLLMGSFHRRSRFGVTTSAILGSLFAFLFPEDGFLARNV